MRKFVIYKNFRFRPITKEEKEQENNKKSIPSKTSALSKHKGVVGQAPFVDNRDESTALPIRLSSIRHHLERTTGPGNTIFYVTEAFIIFN